MREPIEPDSEASRGARALAGAHPDRPRRRRQSFDRVLVVARRDELVRPGRQDVELAAQLGPRFAKGRPDRVRRRRARAGEPAVRDRSRTTIGSRWSIRSIGSSTTSKRPTFCSSRGSTPRARRCRGSPRCSTVGSSSPQEPPRRQERIPADAARLRRVLRLPLSPGRDGGPVAPELSAGAQGQGRAAQHAPLLRHATSTTRTSIRAGGRSASRRSRTKGRSYPRPHGDRRRRDPRPRAAFIDKVKSPRASRSSSG